MGNACSSNKAVDVEPTESPRPAPIYVAGSGLPVHTARVPLSKSRSESNLNKRKHKSKSASNSKESSQVSRSGHTRESSRSQRHHHSSRSKDPNHSSKSRSQPGSAHGTVRGSANTVDAQGDPTRLTRAKSKKKLATVVLDGHKVKVSLKKSHCIFWKAGKCNWGVACKYLHEGVPAMQKTLVNPPTLSAGAPVQPSSKAFVDLVFTGTGTPPRSESPMPGKSPRDPPNKSPRDHPAPPAHSLAEASASSAIPPITIVTTHAAPIDLMSASAPVHLPSQGPVPHAVAVSVSAVERTERLPPQPIHEEQPPAQPQQSQTISHEAIAVSVTVAESQSQPPPSADSAVVRSASTDSVQPGRPASQEDVPVAADENGGVANDAEAAGDGEMFENVPIVISDEAMNDPLLMHHLQSQLEYQNRGPGVSTEDSKDTEAAPTHLKPPAGKARSGHISDGEISSEYSESESDEEDSGSASGSESGPYRNLDSSAPSPAPDAKANSSHLIASVVSLHSGLEDGEIKSSQSIAQGLVPSASTANSIEESKDTVPPLTSSASQALNATKSPKVAPSRIPVLATRAVSATSPANQATSPTGSSASAASLTRSPSVKYRFSFTRSATASNVRAISTPKPAVAVRASGTSANPRPTHAMTRTQSSPAPSRPGTLTKAVPKGSTPADLNSDEAPTTPRRRPSQSAAVGAPTTPRGTRPQPTSDGAPTTPRGQRQAPTTPRGSKPPNSARKAHDDALVSLDHLQHMQPGQLLSPRSKQMINQRTTPAAASAANTRDSAGPTTPRQSGRGGAAPSKHARTPSRSGSSRNMADRPKSSINLGMDDDGENADTSAKFVPFGVVAAEHNSGTQSLQDERQALTGDSLPAPLASSLESGEIAATE